MEILGSNYLPFIYCRSGNAVNDILLLFYTIKNVHHIQLSRSSADNRGILGWQSFIGGGSILNVRGPRYDIMIRAQKLKPRPLISGTAPVKERWTIGKEIVDFKESSNETSIFLTQN